MQLITLLTSVLFILTEGKSTSKSTIHANHVIAKRNAVNRMRLLWPAVIDFDYKVLRVNIPYTVKKGFLWWGGLGDSDEVNIREAMSVIEKHTCVRFIPRKKQRDYIEFYKDDRGFCESDVGRTGGKQTISLGKGCRNPGHITHELMHSLGFYHEHTRPDRDNYVKILWDNIKPGNDWQFEIKRLGEQTSLGQPYDFRSIMHYHRKEFSKNGKDTIESLQDPNMELGSLSSLSAVDVMQVNKLYRCPQTAEQVDNFHITVYTGTQTFAGTDAKVFVELYGNHDDEGTGSGEVQLLSKARNFEQGSQDTFNVISPDIGLLTRMTVRHNNQGVGSGWFLDKIKVIDDKRHKTYLFQCSCWLLGPDNTKTLTPTI